MSDDVRIDPRFIARGILVDLAKAMEILAKLSPQELAVWNHYVEVDALADGYALAWSETDEAKQAECLNMIENYSADMSTTDIEEPQRIAHIKLGGGEFVPRVIQTIIDRKVAEIVLEAQK
jgi:hypothetical protein